MTEFTLSPAPEWATDPAIARHAYKGDWPDRAMSAAFYARYDSRDAALAAATKAGLFPSTEVYGAGRTVICCAGGVRRAGSGTGNPARPGTGVRHLPESA